MIILDAALFPRTQRQVLDRLIGEIDTGTLKPGDLIGNEIALAGRLGVSRNTIRSLMGTLEEAGAVRQVPRCGIFLNGPLKVQSQGVAQPGNREYLYIRWCDSLMESEICSGLGRFARGHGFEVRFLGVNQSVEQLIAIFDHATAATTIVLAPVELPGVVDAMNRALARGVAILQIDRYLDGVDAPAITFDDYSAGFLATRHLIREWHRPVWFFGYLHPISSLKRFQGWRDSMIESGFRDIENYIVPCDYDAVDAEQRPPSYYRDAFRKFYAAWGDAPLSIWCMGDLLALDVYAVVAETGRRVGRDIHLVGSGDIACARLLDPPLSSIRADQEIVGETAGTLLLDWPEIRPYRQILPLELVIRESSRRVDSASAP